MIAVISSAVSVASARVAADKAWEYVREALLTTSGSSSSSCDSCVHGRFDARKCTLNNVEFGGLCNEGIVLKRISRGYEALCDET